MTDKSNSNKRRIDCSMGNETKRHDPGITKESAHFVFPTSLAATQDNHFPYNKEKGEFYNSVTAAMRNLTQMATVEMLEMLRVEEDQPAHGTQQLRDELATLQETLKGLNDKFKEKQKSRDGIIAHYEKKVEQQRQKSTMTLANAARLPKDQLKPMEKVNRTSVLEDLQRKIKANMDLRTAMKTNSVNAKRPRNARVSTTHEQSGNDDQSDNPEDDEIENPENDNNHPSKKSQKEDVTESSDDAGSCDEEEDREDSTEDSVNTSA